MKGAKVAVIVLLVVAVVFVAAVATGAFSGEGSSDPDDPENDWVATLGDLTGGAVTIDPAEVDIECRDPNDPVRLVFPGDCDIDVPRGDGVRLLRLLSQSEIEVTAPAPDEEADFEVTDELATGDTTAVAVGEAGATIELDCEQVGDCAVVLLAEE
ncbi:MAG: hypothetical protein ACRD29_15150 [Acidimicrobiales bacterium]